MFLNCHTFHSLRYGTLSVEELVKQASECGVSELVLTDINTVTAIYDFKKECEKFGIKPIVGVEIRKENRLLYIAIAKDEMGIWEINRMLTNHNCEGAELPEISPNFKRVFVLYPLENSPENLKENEFIGIKEEQLNLLIQPKFQAFLDKMVILHPVTFKTKREFNLHKILRAIDGNTLISKLEENDFCQPGEFFKPVNEILKKFKDHPKIIENTRNLLHTCRFKYNFKTSKNKQHFTESQESDRLLLRKLAYEGLEKRYPEKNEKILKRMEKELSVIDQLKFYGYFLITWDIVQHSRIFPHHLGHRSTQQQSWFHACWKRKWRQFYGELLPGNYRHLSH